MQRHLQIEARAEDVPAQVTGFVRFGDGLLDPPRRLGVLAPDVDEGVIGTQAVGGEHDALDQLMRVALEELPVLEGAGLGLVGVDHQVAGIDGREEPPLDPRREVGPAPPADARSLDFLGHVVRRHRRERLAQRGVATARFIGGQ